jgi:hypothetical protein
MKTAPHFGWNNNLFLENSEAELIITLDVGPRILHFAHKGSPNVLKTYPEQLGGRHEKEWMIRGGHRLWTSPESPEDGHTYDRDNCPVSWKELGANHAVVRRTADTAHGWQKELEVKLAPDANRVTVIHRLEALRDRPDPIGIWALSVMAPGGTAIVPLPALGSHPEDLLPNQLLVIWPYVRMNDSRIIWGEKNLLVKQSAAGKPFKIGLRHQAGVAGYQLGEQLFTKSIAFTEGETYPDFGVNFELFTNGEMLELESLAPLRNLKAGQVYAHTEEWNLTRCPEGTDWTKQTLPSP